MSRFFPYRWRRAPLHNLRSGFDSLWYGIANIIRWSPIIFDDVDFDYEPLVRLMEYKLHRMSRCLANGPTLHGPRNGRQTKLCAELCHRIREDEYMKLANGDVRLAVELAEQDKRYLGMMIGKYLDHWWN